MWTGGYAWTSPEYKAIRDRMTLLEERIDNHSYNDLVGMMANRNTQGLIDFGFMSYVPMTSGTISNACKGYFHMASAGDRAITAAPDAPSRAFALNAQTHFIPFALLHQAPEFDKEYLIGPGGSKLRENIVNYDFDSQHAFSKNTAVGCDLFLFGHNSMGLLHWHGDLEIARTGWLKQIDAWKKVGMLVQSGERTWGEYIYEGRVCGYYAPGDMLMAGEMNLLREWMQVLPGGIAQRDPLVAKEYNDALRSAPFMWQGPNEYTFGRVESFELLDCALSALVDDKIDPHAMRAWLPRPDQLIDIVRHEFIWSMMSVNPALLCATLYMRLGAWEDASTVADAILAIPPFGHGVGFGIPPLVRIETWRLLARCRGARGDSAGACEALECAVTESQAVGYVFCKVLSLRDMLSWVEEDASTHLPGSADSDIQARIDAVACGQAISAGWGCPLKPQNLFA
jgi:hypothetical protein